MLTQPQPPCCGDQVMTEKVLVSPVSGSLCLPGLPVLTPVSGVNTRLTLHNWSRIPHLSPTKLSTTGRPKENWKEEEYDFSKKNEFTELSWSEQDTESLYIECVYLLIYLFNK